MDTVICHSVPGSQAEGNDSEIFLAREWLVTNGLGGYASATISGACTRRYHGLLIAALPAPHGRMVMLNHLSEYIKFRDGRRLRLGGDDEHERSEDLEVHAPLAEFRLEAGLPVWRYTFDGVEIEKRVFLSYRSNTVRVMYRMLSGDQPVRLLLRPSMQFRYHEASVATKEEKPYQIHVHGNRIEVLDNNLPPLRLLAQGAAASLVLDGGRHHDVYYLAEQSRGYERHGRLWSPGYFRIELEPGKASTLTASTEIWDWILAIRPEKALAAELERRERLVAEAHPLARTGPGAELVLAADQFIITPITRAGDAAWASAGGDEVRTIIAGYHWFTDWGRDTMISLEGLTLATGRHAEAGYILRMFAHHVRDGLIPNLFPEGESQGLYHTADATLWFFHALDRYVRATHDQVTLKNLLPTLESIVEHHLKGTRFGIHVDPSDGLLRQGEEGFQLTWMDAKVDGWVVTPRRGKAVEINALWYNSLRLLESWLRDDGSDDRAQAIGQHAARARESFNRRFWNESRSCLFDVVDGEAGDDPLIRPNQILAVSLPNAVLDPARWKCVVDVVTERLLTPVGLRSLAPGEPEYKPKYYGDLRSRDAAYHQGTVWGWLIGPYIDAWMKVHANQASRGHELLKGLIGDLSESGLGSISEIFDAEPPYTPRGCIAQAWSIAEALRCWIKTTET